MNDFHGRGWSILIGDVLERLRELPTNYFHCVVTSPPYWGLRDYGIAGQIGIENSLDEYLLKLVEVFCEVRRVLRFDGVLWLNLGDLYCSTPNSAAGCETSTLTKAKGRPSKIELAPMASMRKKCNYGPGVKQKDLVGLPWKVAFALRDDGWFLRSECIWAKRNPMSESVEDRPTKGHEQIFLFSKSKRYFYDFVGVRTKSKGAQNGNKSEGKYHGRREEHRTKSGWAKYQPLDSANLRTIWHLSTEPFRGSHFATFPTKLARICILAGTSERGCCPTCGSPIRRIIEKQQIPTRPGTNSKINRASDKFESPYHIHRGTIIGNRDPRRKITSFVTVGWKQNCHCEPLPSIPCRVLDPFVGSGTTLVVARRLGCEATGIELSEEYALMASHRIVDDAPLFNALHEEESS